MKILLLFFIFFWGVVLYAQHSVINTAHLDFLYEKIRVDNEDMGIIHIYCNYPYDKWTGDDDEGVACVDDAARAAVFYIKYFKYKKDSAALDKAKNLIKFVLFMQAENGFFYNFIWPDHSINKTYKTSVSEPNWWSWRALWALAEGYDFFKQLDTSFSDKIIKSLRKSVDAALKWLPSEKSYSVYGGFSLPAWLPFETASDQSAILILGLVKYSSSANDTSSYKYIRLLCDGLMQMQAGSDSIFPYYAFLSWRNTWHAWGNNQASALISAGKLLNNRRYINAALKEVKVFYPYLVENGYLSNFTVEKSADSIIIKDSLKFSQIAYGIRPMVFASLLAFDESQNEEYARIAGKLSQWFFGNNPADTIMYSAASGRCFDGINNTDEINRNSGAESTIEALLALLEAEQNKISRMYFDNEKKD